MHREYGSAVKGVVPGACRNDAQTTAECLVKRVSGMPRELRTDRLLLRRWLPADQQPFAALNADPRVTEYLPGTLSREEVTP